MQGQISDGPSRAETEEGAVVFGGQPLTFAFDHQRMRESTRNLSLSFSKPPIKPNTSWGINYSNEKAWTRLSNRFINLSRSVRDKIRQLAFERCRMLSVLWPTQSSIDEVQLDILREHEFVQIMETRMHKLRSIVEAGRIQAIQQGRSQRPRSFVEGIPLVGKMVSRYYDGIVPTLTIVPPRPRNCDFEVISLFDHVITIVHSNMTVHDLTINIQNATGMDPNDQLLMNDNLEIINDHENIQTGLHSYCKTHPSFGKKNRIIIISKNPRFNHILSGSHALSILNNREYIHYITKVDDIRRTIEVYYNPRGNQNIRLIRYTQHQLRCISINEIKMTVSDMLRIHPACIVVSLNQSMREILSMVQLNHLNSPIQLHISLAGIPEYVYQNKLYGNFFEETGVVWGQVGDFPIRFRENKLHGNFFDEAGHALWGLWGDFPIEEEEERKRITNAAATAAPKGERIVAIERAREGNREKIEREEIARIAEAARPADAMRVLQAATRSRLTPAVASSAAAARTLQTATRSRLAQATFAMSRLAQAAASEERMRIALASAPDKERILAAASAPDRERIRDLIRALDEPLTVHAPYWWHSAVPILHRNIIQKCDNQTDTEESSDWFERLDFERLNRPECLGIISVGSSDKLNVNIGTPTDTPRAFEWFYDAVCSYSRLTGIPHIMDTSRSIAYNTAYDIFQDALERKTVGGSIHTAIPGQNTELSFCQFLSIYFYTGDSEYSIYSMLRNSMQFPTVGGGTGHSYVERISHNLITLLYSASYKCPQVRELHQRNLTNGATHLYRCMPIPENIYDMYCRDARVNNRVTFYCFQSFSLNLNSAIRFAKRTTINTDHLAVLRIIVNDNTTARYIAPYAVTEEEEEVLALPCIPYIVTEIFRFQNPRLFIEYISNSPSPIHDLSDWFTEYFTEYLVITLSEESYMTHAAAPHHPLNG